MRYRHLEFSAACAKPTHQEFVALEKLAGAPLPDDFKEFLRRANGAYIDDYDIDIILPSGDAIVNFPTIFCTLGDGDDTFVGEVQRRRDRANLPTGTLPFARDAGGSVAYLDLRPEGGGAVMAFIEVFDDGQGWREEACIVRLADSFGEYVDKLYVEPVD